MWRDNKKVIILILEYTLCSWVFPTLPFHTILIYSMILRLYWYTPWDKIQFSHRPNSQIYLIGISSQRQHSSNLTSIVLRLVEINALSLFKQLFHCPVLFYRADKTCMNELWSLLLELLIYTPPMQHGNEYSGRFLIVESRLKMLISMKILKKYFQPFHVTGRYKNFPWILNRFEVWREMWKYSGVAVCLKIKFFSVTKYFVINLWLNQELSWKDIR